MNRFLLSALLSTATAGAAAHAGDLVDDYVKASAISRFAASRCVGLTLNPRLVGAWFRSAGNAALVVMLSRETATRIEDQVALMIASSPEADASRTCDQLATTKVASPITGGTDEPVLLRVEP